MRVGPSESEDLLTTPRLTHGGATALVRRQAACPFLPKVWNPYTEVGCPQRSWDRPSALLMPSENVKTPVGQQLSQDGNGPHSGLAPPATPGGTGPPECHTGDGHRPGWTSGSVHSPPKPRQILDISITVLNSRSSSNSWKLFPWKDYGQFWDPSECSHRNGVPQTGQGGGGVGVAAHWLRDPGVAPLRSGLQTCPGQAAGGCDVSEPPPLPVLSPRICDSLLGTEEPLHVTQGGAMLAERQHVCVLSRGRV